MHKTSIFLFLSLVFFSSCGDGKRDKIGKTEVVMETTYGDITLRLYDDTPQHRDNFIKNAESGAYDNIIFHRIVKDQIIQSGDPMLKAVDVSKGEKPHTGTKRGSKWDYTIPCEILYPRHFHKAGALCAARENDSINPQKRSSGTQFYIVTGEVYTLGSLAELHQAMDDADTLHALPSFTAAQKQAYTTHGGCPHLDGEYTVFGEVVDGMNVVERIGKTPTDGQEHPLKQIVIKKVRVEK